MADLETGVSGSGGSFQGETRDQDGAALWRWPWGKGAGKLTDRWGGAGTGQVWTLV